MLLPTRLCNLPDFRLRNVKSDYKIFVKLTLSEATPYLFRFLTYSIPLLTFVPLKFFFT